MTLYVSDLDGTLLNNTATVSEASKVLLNKAISNNINFTIATARTPATIVPLLKGINLNLPVIAMNGSAIYDIHHNKYLYFSTLENSSVYILKNLINKYKVNAFIYTLKDSHLYVYHNKLTHPYQIKFYNERKDSPYKTFLENTLPLDVDVLYFTIMDYEDKILDLYNEVKNISNISAVKYRDTYDKDIVNLEIYNVSTSKANAINYLKNYFNFNKIVSFGDNLNDIPMFKISDECYAVDNACNELKDICTNVIGSNTCDSVAKYIYDSSLKN